jgi:ectoine hydroxylase-related dioxygenase (phytanoyl-CoA dioxygenase family)
MTAAPLEPPPSKEMRLANPALGDSVALQAIWDECGYWFFRDVLDKEAVAGLRRAFIEALVEMGVVDPGSEDAVWNGKDLGGFPDKIESLHDKRVWQRFVANPKIEAFFEQLLGGPVFWVPIVEYRLTPPARSPWPDAYVGRHQDRFANEGIAFRTCWIPLHDIDARTGGLAIAEGMHRLGVIHNVNDPPLYPIPPGIIPDESWARSDYHPGDLVVFRTTVPHAGFPNYSDRFRLSMDIRVMPRSAKLPIVGQVVQAAPERVVVHNHDGRDVALILDDSTYCRWFTGQRLLNAEMARKLTPGQLVMASEQDGRALLLRPQR